MSAAVLEMQLAAGLDGLAGVDPDAGQRTRLIEYLALLHKWNCTYNLTAVRDPADMVTRHLLDSLAVLPWIGDGRILDAGSGGGLPGIPLAIARPEQPFTLLDSAGKKVRFLNHVKRTLGLENIHPVQARLENHRPAEPYRAVISRAFTSLAAFAVAVRQTGSCDRLLAMKGRPPADEIEALPEWVKVEKVVKLSVPGLQEDRHLVIMCLSS